MGRIRNVRFPGTGDFKAWGAFSDKAEEAIAVVYDAGLKGIAAKAKQVGWTGTGLSLSMTYGTARQSGGHVRIQFELGLSTAVSLCLPCQHGETEVDAGDGEAARLGRVGRGGTILVVEVLEEMGNAIIEAADGVASLKIIHSDARIGLLVTDVGLPGWTNGRQTADSACGGRPDLKVLSITGYGDGATVGGGRLGLGVQVLTKPLVGKEFIGEPRACEE